LAAIVSAGTSGGIDFQARHASADVARLLARLPNQPEHQYSDGFQKRLQIGC
jgi:hypothetical protein